MEYSCEYYLPCDIIRCFRGIVSVGCKNLSSVIRASPLREARGSKEFFRNEPYLKEHALMRPHPRARARVARIFALAYSIDVETRDSSGRKKRTRKRGETGLASLYVAINERFR